MEKDENLGNSVIPHTEKLWTCQKYNILSHIFAKAKDHSTYNRNAGWTENSAKYIYRSVIDYE